MSEHSEFPEDFNFASTTSFKPTEIINHEVFERTYFELLKKLSLVIDPDMNYQEFQYRDGNTIDTIRAARLNNKDITYFSEKDFAQYFYSFTMSPEEFFPTLKLVLSSHLMRQVKSIESLLRFESCLKHGKTTYDLMFNLNSCDKKFKTPETLYSILFSYEAENPFTAHLLFKFKTNMLSYVESAYNPLGGFHTVDIIGYENIYAHIFNRIKELLTSSLNVNAEDLSDKSVLLYRMLLV